MSSTRRCTILIACVLTFVAAIGRARATTVCTADDFPCPPAGTCTITGAWDVDDGAACELDFGSRDVVLRGTLRALESGGSIAIRARSLLFDGGKLRATGDGADWGGSVSIEVGLAFAMQGAGSQLSADGGDLGGTIEVTAGSIAVSNGTITAKAGEEDGNGGTITLSATGDATVRTSLDASGAGPQGWGGTVDVVSETGRVELGGSWSVEGRGAESSGGDLEVSAGTDVLLDANLTASGGVDGLGSMAFAAGGRVELRPSRTLRVRGGTISSTSPRDFVADGTIDVSGRAGEDGGTIELDHCTITVGGTLDARGGSGASGGLNWLTGGAITVRAGGALVATSCTQHCNLLVSRTTPVIQPGATIAPAAEIRRDDSLVLCCGNGVEDDGEECDDGNARHCDGCTPRCREVIGDECADADPCTGGCDPTVGCLPLDGVACAPDTNPCTDDVCRSGVCTHDSPCDDVGDSPCRQGTCTPGGCVFDDAPYGTPCSVGQCGSICDAGTCLDPCDDGDACTQGFCLIPGWCVQYDDRCAPSCAGRPDGAPCSDGDACTTGTCQGGACTAAAVECNACELATCAGAYGCIQTVTCEDDGNPCTLEQCDPSAGGCAAEPLTGVACSDDGDPCTADVCDAGTCTHVASGCGGTTTTSTSTTSSSSTSTSSTSTTSTSTTTTSTSSSTSTVPPPAVPIQTTAFTMKDARTPVADPSARRVTFRSSTRRDAGANRIVVPGRGTTGDPTSAGSTGGGAVLVVHNAAGSGEQVRVELGAGGWSALGSPLAPTGYRYQGPAGGAVERIIVKADLLRVSGGGAAWSYSLDEASQGRMGLRLTLGSAATWCADAPAKASGNPPSTAANDRAGRFVAQPRSPASAVCASAP